MMRLRAITAGAAIAVSIGTVILAPSPWMLLIDGLAFATAAAVALRVLAEIDDLTRPVRRVSAAERAASLRPRKASEFLPWSWRLAAAGTAVLGATAFVARASSVGGGQRMFMPIRFAAAALIFLWLYEVWAHQVITGPIVDGRGGHPAPRRPPHLRDGTAARRGVPRHGARAARLQLGCERHI
jgi:hypothetical protein